MKSELFECPNCGHKVSREEDEAELSSFGVWICPKCGFQLGEIPDYVH